MDPLLVKYYGANPTEEQIKTAAYAAGLLEKTAREEGVDLDKISDEDLGGMWDTVMAKAASADKVATETPEASVPSTDDTDDLRKQAAEELAKLAESEKIAEISDQMGRRAAHAFIAELDKIASDREAAGAAAPAGDPKIAEMGAAFKAMIAKHKGKGDKDGDDKDDDHKEPDGDEGKGGKGDEDGDEKKASAIDELGFRAGLALIEKQATDAKASEAEVVAAVKTAAERMRAVYTLTAGVLPGGTKVAAAGGDADLAAHIRGLELLEAAGYPVNWG